MDLGTFATFAYHEVTDDPASTGFQRPGAVPYRLSRAAFADHLAALASGAMVPELVTAVDPTRPSRHFLLTFDDGGKSALEVGALLARRDWRAHFFIITNLLGTRTFLDAAGVRELRTMGHLIGSHSHTHPSIFREQPADRMLQEWQVSRDRLAQILGEPCVVASVPGGDISPAVLRSADTAGFEHLFTSEPWLRPRRIGTCWVFGRFMAKASTPVDEIEGLVRFRGWERALLVRRLKVAARYAMAPLYRRLVRRRTRAWEGNEP